MAIKVSSTILDKHVGSAEQCVVVSVYLYPAPGTALSALAAQHGLDCSWADRRLTSPRRFLGKINLGPPSAV